MTLLAIFWGTVKTGEINDSHQSKNYGEGVLPDPEMSNSFSPHKYQWGVEALKCTAEVMGS